MDATYGVGRWRPQVRFLIHQAEKTRVIDDARRGGHNEGTKMEETIFTVGNDFGAHAASVVFKAILKIQSPPAANYDT